MSVAKESKWCDEAHAALCGALADALFDAGSSPAKHKDAIMEFMASKGQSFTWEGIRQHLQKLRRKEGTTATANGGNDDAGQKKTPNKKPGPKATANSNKRGPKRKSTADATKAEDDDDLDMNGSSPTKKVKTENNNTTNALEDEDEDNLPPIC